MKVWFKSKIKSSRKSTYILLLIALASVIFIVQALIIRNMPETSDTDLPADKDVNIQLVELTLAEKDYLQKNKNIKICVDPDWEPYEKIDEKGEYRGIAADLVQLIKMRTGVNLELLETQNWQESIEISKAGECTILPFLNQTPEREEWLIFTKTYFSDPGVFITREEHDYISNLSRFPESTIALPAGTSTEEMIREKYPDIAIIITDSESRALKMVQDRKADMTLRPLTMAAYVLRKEALFNLKIAGQLPDIGNDFKMGISKDQVVLKQILDKGISTITPGDIQRIINNHISIQIKTDVDYSLVVKSIVIFIIILIAGFLLHKREIKYAAHLRLIIDTVPGYIFVKDNAGRFILANKAFADLFDMRPDDIVGKKDIDYGASDELAAGYLETDRKVIESGEPLIIPEEQVLRKDRTLGWFQTTKTPYINPYFKKPAVLGVSIDITERRLNDEKMRYMAQYDSLTNLPNRALFFDRLGVSLRLARRENTKLALMFLDLDRFKPVNDTYGHSAGDIVLKEVSARIQKIIRSSDTAGRIGGDEFVICLYHVENKEELYEIAEKLRLALESPYFYEGNKITISASIGFSLFPEHGTDENTLVCNADTAMYKAKNMGRNQVAMFTP